MIKHNLHKHVKKLKIEKKWNLNLLQDSKVTLI